MLEKFITKNSISVSEEGGTLLHLVRFWFIYPPNRYLHLSGQIGWDIASRHKGL